LIGAAAAAEGNGVAAGSGTVSPKSCVVLRAPFGAAGAAFAAAGGGAAGRAATGAPRGAGAPKSRATGRSSSCSPESFGLGAGRSTRRSISPNPRAGAAFCGGAPIGPLFCCIGGCVGPRGATTGKSTSSSSSFWSGAEAVRGAQRGDVVAEDASRFWTGGGAPGAAPDRSAGAGKSHSASVITSP
jgi:hypothetical protein